MKAYTYVKPVEQIFILSKGMFQLVRVELSSVMKESELLRKLEQEFQTSKKVTRF